MIKLCSRAALGFGVREAATPAPDVAPASPMHVTGTDQVKADLGKAKVEVREEAVRRVYVDGKAVGPAVPISR